MIRPLHRELAFGDEVGRYRLIAELARGGMGIVYLASTRGPAGFNKLLALKQLKPELIEDPNFLQMFLDEARVAARLSHPNIVQTNDVEQSDGRYFIAMEYLEGRSFSQVLKRFSKRGGFPLQMSLLVLRDVLSALDYAHSFSIDGQVHGVVHRDISPQNIFVTFEGWTKVIDFGIAKAHDSIIETKTGVLKGKVQYMAPEQLIHRAEARSDIFSVGAVLYEVVTGQKLWAGMNEIEIMGHLARLEIPPVQTTLPGVPSILLKICRTALSPKLDERYATAAEMRDAIDEYLWSTRGTPQSREIGAKLLEAFGPEREAAQQAVQAHLDGNREHDGGQLPSLQPVAAAEAAEQDRQSRLYSVARLQSGMSQSMISASSAVGGSAMPQSHGIKVAIAAVVGLVVVGGVIGLGVRGGTVPVPVAVSSAPQPAAESTVKRELRAPAAVPVEMIAFSVAVSPQTAKVSIDGESMPSNPFLGRFAKDYAMHRVRATAPGFVSKERVVSFADNVMIDLSLDPRAAPAPAASPARKQQPGRRSGPTIAAPAELAPPVHVVPQPMATAAPAPRSSAPGDITPRRGSESSSRRAIDSSNPYGEDQ